MITHGLFINSELITNSVLMIFSIGYTLLSKHFQKSMFKDSKMFYDVIIHFIIIYQGI